MPDLNKTMSGAVTLAGLRALLLEELRGYVGHLSTPALQEAIVLHARQVLGTYAPVNFGPEDFEVRTNVMDDTVRVQVLPSRSVVARRIQALRGLVPGWFDDAPIPSQAVWDRVEAAIEAIGAIYPLRYVYPTDSGGALLEGEGVRVEVGADLRVEGVSVYLPEAEALEPTGDLGELVTWLRTVAAHYVESAKARATLVAGEP